MRRLIQAWKQESCSLSLSEMCQLSLIARHKMYYTARERRRTATLCSAQLVDAIHKVSAEKIYYGHRRVFKAIASEPLQDKLYKRKVYDIMKSEGLSLPKCRKKHIITTKSSSDQLYFPDLKKGLILTDIDQLWVSDITYVRITNGHAYLATVKDSFSRMCLGWAFQEHMMDSLVIEALHRAIKLRKLQLIHNNQATNNHSSSSFCSQGTIVHTDRGSQYGSNAYANELRRYGLRPSMGGTGNCYDNAQSESFNGTIKVEHLYSHEVSDFRTTLAGLARYLELEYNKERLHSAIGYTTPAVFEQGLRVARQINT